MSTSSSIAVESRKPPELLEQEIDQQRNRIDALIDDVEARLTPRRLLDQALAYGRDSGGLEMAERLGHTLKTNPVPVALTAIGLAWLAVEQSRGRPQPVADPGDTEDGETLADALHEAKQSLHQGTLAARQKLHDLAEGAETLKHQVKQGADSLTHTLQRRPWAFAAAGLALGAVVGILGTVRKDEAHTDDIPERDDGLQEKPPFRPGAV
ncbi:DUF3618 domain-containing protein [Phytopseudomonas dryadis]|uniref:DUF3618 domain-containing protein n=1 Tax=Phytopseudomonas dryadis TaxID=2487520 RepID=A0A4Q9R3G6_9GAMM|nr:MULTISPECIES: DUF3618 domain-containing protein [Pseudomonas]TBU93978.1 hypothetical protein DNK44_09900 [Pseudomonas dryadis]TBV07860.1 hypothetical protein DNK34_06715 [Pseudomonas dryadis]TBV19255.1 hypothetical protein DNK41_03900 [Pseudomonas sp. FRB 230]